MTLREIWEQQGRRPTEVAADAGISLPTLYKINRKEGKVNAANLANVLRVLDITRQQYDELEASKQ